MRKLLFLIGFVVAIPVLAIDQTVVPQTFNPSLGTRTNVDTIVSLRGSVETVTVDLQGGATGETYVVTIASPLESIISTVTSTVDIVIHPKVPTASNKGAAYTDYGKYVLLDDVLTITTLRTAPTNGTTTNIVRIIYGMDK